MRKAIFRRLFRQALSQRVKEYSAANFTKSAVVFAPHPDDETLGCGGMILKKKMAGARVTVVFMTDGRTSHAHLMAEQELVALRRQEALAACAHLGIGADDVAYLAFADGELASHTAEAVTKVAALLQMCQPEEIFLPYQRDVQPDHLATNAIVRQALGHAGGKTPAIYEYPIWAWHHWPWVGVNLGMRRATFARLQASLQLRFGLQMLQDFQLGIPIGDIVDQKLLALAQHQSQMTPLLPDCGWLTLHDVAGGEWLECFFQPYEFLRPVVLRAE